MPRLLWLMFQVPMSSPQMTRMFGFSWAAAGEAAATNARHTKDPRIKCLLFMQPS